MKESMLERSPWLIPLTLLVLLAPLSANAEPEGSEAGLSPKRLLPNKTVREEVIAFGRDYESAEKAANIRAWELAYEGTFKVKGISFGSVSSSDYCVLTIEHDIVLPPGNKLVDETVVAFAKSAEDALAAAKVRAMQRIRKNPRSRPNLTETTVPQSVGRSLPIPEPEIRQFLVDRISFRTYGNQWMCYLKFVYMEAE